MSKSPKFKLSDNNSLTKKNAVSVKVVAKPKSELMKKVSTPTPVKEKTMTAKKVQPVPVKPVKPVTPVKVAQAPKAVKAAPAPVVTVKAVPKPSVKKSPLQRAMVAPKEPVKTKAKAAPAPKPVSKAAMLTTKQLLTMQEKAIASVVG